MSFLKRTIGVVHRALSSTAPSTEDSSLIQPGAAFVTSGVYRNGKPQIRAIACLIANWSRAGQDSFFVPRLDRVGEGERGQYAEKRREDGCREFHIVRRDKRICGMLQSLIKLSISAEDSLFREVRVKPKNIGVSALKIFISLECLTDCSMQPEGSDDDNYNSLFPDLFQRQCVRPHRIILSADLRSIHRKVHQVYRSILFHLTIDFCPLTLLISQDWQSRALGIP